MPAFFIFLCILLCSHGHPTAALADSSTPSPQPVAWPLIDDMGFQGLENALLESCRYYDNAPDRIFELCNQRLSGRELGQAYSQLINRLRGYPQQDVGPFLAENFSLCSPAPLLVTGYYTPILAGSLTPSATYRFPLHSLPARDDLRTLNRTEIDTSRRLKEYELAYVADPVDLFFLHVQGSGIIKLPDGSERLISYAGDNGRPYTSIGKLLIQEGKLSSDEVSLATIYDYLHSHPEQRQRILHHNERYIFFQLSAPGAATTRPTGSMGYPLTPGRSVALDDKHYPPGILGVLSGQLPHFAETGEITWQPLQRLVCHQDSGAAIAGPQRLDLYLGSGEQAGQVAGLMKGKGNFAILIPNLSLRRVHSKIEATSHFTYAE